MRNNWICLCGLTELHSRNVNTLPAFDFFLKATSCTLFKLKSRTPFISHHRIKDELPHTVGETDTYDKSLEKHFPHLAFQIAAKFITQPVREKERDGGVR